MGGKIQEKNETPILFFSAQRRLVKISALNLSADGAGEGRVK